MEKSDDWNACRVQPLATLVDCGSNTIWGLEQLRGEYTQQNNE